MFTDILINYDISDEDEVNFNGVLELEYACLEVTADPQTLVAVVCEEDTEEEEDERNFVRKCCPIGQSLAKIYLHAWTLHMSGFLQGRFCTLKQKE